jgi:hypothetical protein
MTHRHLSFGTMDRKRSIARMARVMSGFFAEYDSGIAF